MSAWNAEDWSTQIINGPGGLQDYKRREIAELSHDPWIEGAIWALRCVSNPNCEGSHQTLKAIEARRYRMLFGEADL